MNIGGQLEGEYWGGNLKVNIGVKFQFLTLLSLCCDLVHGCGMNVGVV